MSKQFAEFRVGDVLSITPTVKPTVVERKGSYIKDDEVVEEGGKIPYIAAISTNNGIKGWTNITPRNSAGSITLSTTADSSNTVFYQPVDYVGRQQVAKIQHNDSSPLSFREAMYLSTLLKKITQSFNYGNKLTRGGLEDSTITLPVTDESAGTESPEPDWEYMETYIKEIEEKYLDSVVKYNKRNGEILDTLYPDYHGSAPEAHDYAEFRVGDILEFRKGKRVTKSDQIAGKIPYVTAATENNGIDSWIGNAIFTQENVITVNFFGKCFYHPYEVAYKDGTYGAKIRDQRFQLREHYLYLTSALEKATENVGSYSKMLTDTIAMDLAITLPVTPTGEPDWVFMEDYIDYIAGGGRRIARYVQHKKSTSSSS